MNKSILFFLAHALLLCSCAPATLEPTVMPAASALPITATSLPTTVEPTATAKPTATPLPTNSNDWMSRQNPVAQLHWTAENKSLVVLASSGIHVFDIRSRMITRTIVDGFFYPSAFDPQNNRFFAKNKVWDITNGALLYQITPTEAFIATFSPDGKSLAIGESNYISIWNASTGKLEKAITPGLGIPFFGLRFNPSGNQLVGVYEDGKVRQINLDLKLVTELFILPQHGSHSVFSPDLHYLLINRSNHGEGHKELWDAVTGKALITSERCDSDVTFAAFSANNQFFVIGPCGRDAQLWDIQSQKIVQSFPSIVGPEVHPEWHSAAFSWDGSLLALGNDLGEIQIWDMAAYQLFETLSIPNP